MTSRSVVWCGAGRSASGPVSHSARRADQWPAGPLTTVGQKVPRVDGAQRARGQAPYTADLALPGMLHTAVLRSPHARARVTYIDLTPAVSAPGVRAALGPDDLEQLTREPGYVGHAIAAVAAETFGKARAALDLIDVEWEVLEPLLDADEAVRRESFLSDVKHYERGNLGVALEDLGSPSDREVVEAAHAAGAPWRGKSALDAVELMDAGWNFRREHLRLAQRSHYVITNGGDQPNVVPPNASVWYYFRELDYPRIKELYELGNKMAQAATMMTDTTVTKRMVGSAWPCHFNKPIAEVQQKNIEMVGMPVWSEADQTLAKALQKEIGATVEGLKTKVKQLEQPPKDPTGGGSDDVGDISWNLPMVYMRYPANIPNLPGHSWPNAVAMATPIAHKGSAAGANRSRIDRCRPRRRG